MFIPLITGATTPVTSPTVNIDDREVGRDEIAVQVSITGTATVQLFGRLHSSHAWVQLGSNVVSSSIVPLVRVAELYAAVTANSGTVSVGLQR